MFFTLSEKKKAFKARHPRAKLLSLGIGDVSLPLSQSALHALLKAASEQGHAASFQGYQPECGASFLRSAVAAHYARRGIALSEDEIFVSSGAGEDLGLLPGLFSPENLVLIPSPCYPAYAEVAAMHGMRVLPLRCDAKSGFLPLPPRDIDAGVIYLCSPQNPTGVAMPRRLLQDWVNYANACGAVIIYDAAYEAFLAGSAYPRSIFEMEGSRSCAVEICSFSKSAGFTGLRCGYTRLAVPRRAKPECHVGTHKICKDERRLLSRAARRRSRFDGAGAKANAKGHSKDAAKCRGSPKSPARPCPALFRRGAFPVSLGRMPAGDDKQRLL